MFVSRWWWSARAECYGKRHVAVRLACDEHGTAVLRLGRLGGINAQCVECFGQLGCRRFLQAQPVDDQHLAFLDALGEP